MNAIRVVLLPNKSIANDLGLKSQLDCVILMTDKEPKANIAHYGSNRAHRTTRPVIAAEVHALIHAVDVRMNLQDALNEMSNRSIGTEAFVDSQSLLNVVTRHNKTAEKRLKIEIFTLKGSYKIKELKRIGWNEGKENPEDVLTEEVT